MLQDNDVLLDSYSKQIFFLTNNKEIFNIDSDSKRDIKTASCDVPNLLIKLSVPTKGRCFLKGGNCA